MRPIEGNGVAIRVSGNGLELHLAARNYLAGRSPDIAHNLRWSIGRSGRRRRHLRRGCARGGGWLRSRRRGG
ncbi:MAG: hypothetical protein HY671_14970 [Chloroflexi bacterium]|nr:hypothetical protein [Chloroflexota bacterium]